MLSVPLKKGDFYETHIACRLASLYLQFKPTIWTLSYLHKHTNCTILLQERHFPTPLRHIEK